MCYTRVNDHEGPGENRQPRAEPTPEIWDHRADSPNSIAQSATVCQIEISPFRLDKRSPVCYTTLNDLRQAASGRPRDFSYPQDRRSIAPVEISVDNLTRFGGRAIVWEYRDRRLFHKFPGKLSTGLSPERAFCLSLLVIPRLSPDYPQEIHNLSTGLSTEHLFDEHMFDPKIGKNGPPTGECAEISHRRMHRD